MNYQKVHEKKTIIREIHIKPTMRYHDTSFEWPYYRRTEPSDREDVEHAQLALLSIWQQASSFLSPLPPSLPHSLPLSLLPSFLLPSFIPSFLFFSFSITFNVIYKLVSSGGWCHHGQVLVRVLFLACP